MAQMALLEYSRRLSIVCHMHTDKQQITNFLSATAQFLTDQQT